MPIDPNIAMGVRPIEQPNMLAQMGQMMQLRQAQQGYESENALRDFYSQGGDTSTAEGRRKLMSTVGLKGADILKKEAETENTRATTSKTKADNIKVNVANSVAALAGVNDLPSYMAWHEANHDAKINPAMADYFKTMGIDPNQSKAHIAEVVAKLGPVAGLEQLKKESMGAVPDLFKHITQSEDNRQTNIQSNTNNIRTTGATTRGQDLTNARAMEGTWASVIVGDRVMEHNNRTGEWREASVPESTGGTVTVGAPTTLPPTASGGGAPPAIAPQAAPTNALAPQAAGAAPVANALVQPPATATPAPARQPLTTFNPKKVARETTNAAGDVTQYNERGEVIAVVPKAGKPSAAYEKDLVTEAKKVEGQKTVQTLVASLADQYKGLLQEGGITSTAQGAMSNIGARSGASGAGQYVAGFIGTKAQELRDSIAQTRPLIINAIKDSTGMSAQQLNSNVELQNFLKAATDPTLSIEANLKALNNLSKLYGLGKELTMADMKGTPANTGNIAADPTIDALLNKYK